MDVPLNVLLIEDSAKDAELILRELRKGGYAPKSLRVDSADGLARALERDDWDLITCNYSIPGLSGAAALDQVRRRTLAVPVIIVTGDLGDGTTIAAMKFGAHDVVSKRALGRLVPAINRELPEAAERRARLAAEEAYRTVVEHSLQGLTIFQGGRIVFANPAAAAMLGHSVASLLSLSSSEVLAFLTPEDRPEMEDRIARRLAGQPLADRAEVRVQRHDGLRFLEFSTRRVEFRGQPAIQTMLVDVTERRAAQEALQRAEQRWRNFIEKATDVIYTLDAAGRITSVNQAGCTLTGYDAEELIGMSPADLVVPEERGNASAALGRILKGEEIDHYEVEIIRKDGRRVWLEIRGQLVHEGDRVVEVFHIARDVTERRRAEEERARLIAAVEQTVESIMITDLEGRIVYVNAACERMTGYARSELLGRDPRILRSGHHEADAYRRMLSTLAGCRVWHWAEVQRRKDGTLYEVDVVVFPVYDGTGRLINYVGLGRDVTRERQVEAQLRHAHTLEATERLAGGMAHDFNNQLTVIKGCVQLLLGKLPPGDPRRHEAEQINATVDRSARLVRQLLTFSRPQPIDARSEDLSEVIRAVEPMLRVLLGERIRLHVSVAADLARVRADRRRIEQVVMNLVGNARDFMDAAGGPRPTDSVTIETRNVMLDALTPGVVESLQPGPYVVLTVTDSGPGMSADVQEHLFEPFFTTKEIGEGSGMGLATVFGIVRQHGAHITCTSQPGEGTTFRIYFAPEQVMQAPLSESVAGARAEAEGAQRRVLVAEDEDVLRDLLVRALSGAGYEVHSAKTGPQALAMARGIGAPIDLFVSDVVMPGESGVSVARRLQREQPGMRVLLVSGYLADALDISRIPGGRFMQKPFSLESLLQNVRDLLA
jgi:two-component system cell cycle sensor histidine kinase/response regulator CckA